MASGSFATIVTMQQNGVDPSRLAQRSLAAAEELLKKAIQREEITRTREASPERYTLYSRDLSPAPNQSVELPLPVSDLDKNDLKTPQHQVLQTVRPVDKRATAARELPRRNERVNDLVQWTNVSAKEIEEQIVSLEALHNRMHSLNRSFVRQQRGLMEEQGDAAQEQTLKQMKHLQALHDQQTDWQARVNQIKKMQTMYTAPQSVTAQLREVTNMEVPTQVQTAPVTSHLPTTRDDAPSDAVTVELSKKLQRVEHEFHHAMTILTALKEGLASKDAKTEALAMQANAREATSTVLSSMQDALKELGDLSQRMNWSPVDILLPSNTSNSKPGKENKKHADTATSPTNLRVLRVDRVKMLGGDFDYDAAQKVLVELRKLRRDMMLPMYNRLDIAIPVEEVIKQPTMDTLDDVLNADRVRAEVRRTIGEMENAKETWIPTVQPRLHESEIYHQAPRMQSPQPGLRPKPVQTVQVTKSVEPPPKQQQPSRKKQKQSSPPKRRAMEIEIQRVQMQTQTSPSRNGSPTRNAYPPHRPESPGIGFAAPFERAPSPLRPPNFYNVRLSNMPIFLRRTSVRPPTLGFLDNLPPPRSPTKRTPSPTKRAAPAPRPVSPPPLPIKKASKTTSTNMVAEKPTVKVFDEAVQTSAPTTMVTHSTQVTDDTSSHVEVPPPLLKAYQNTGVQSDPPLHNVGVQYDSPPVSEAVQTMSEKPSPRLPERVQSEVLLRILQKAKSIEIEPPPQIPESAFTLVLDSIINEVVDEAVVSVARQCLQEARDREDERARLEAAERYRRELLETEELLRHLREAAEDEARERKVEVETQVPPQTPPIQLEAAPDASESSGPGLSTLSTVMSEGEVLTNLYSEGEIVDRFPVGAYDGMFAAARGRDNDATSADILTQASEVASYAGVHMAKSTGALSASDGELLTQDARYEDGEFDLSSEKGIVKPEVKRVVKKSESRTSAPPPVMASSSKAGGQRVVKPRTSTPPSSKNSQWSETVIPFRPESVPTRVPISSTTSRSNSPRMSRPEPAREEPHGSPFHKSTPAKSVTPSQISQKPLLSRNSTASTSLHKTPSRQSSLTESSRHSDESSRRGSSGKDWSGEDEGNSKSSPEMSMDRSLLQASDIAKIAEKASKLEMPSWSSLSGSDKQQEDSGGKSSSHQSILDEAAEDGGEKDPSHYSLLEEAVEDGGKNSSRYSTLEEAIVNGGKNSSHYSDLEEAVDNGGKTSSHQSIREEAAVLSKQHSQLTISSDKRSSLEESIAKSVSEGLDVLSDHIASARESDSLLEPSHDELSATIDKVSRIDNLESSAKYYDVDEDEYSSDFE
ncbi:hypothetical protein SmJEL517_g03630 [Synchytrium microbalum]|uniref:Uncharacterized protein n=1 Tax=Synchytrium microbalum TaxID=1806994 RepID=A0A507C691_9FUNG|nr:uncharacterized protein SmJEL517_g03630 [Synchytrium microbalum]TPX33486.1 hypothetical protein SmJEL517_g03630 [Synchytrium microbalum]